MNARIFVFALALGIAGTAYAETAYVTNQLSVNLQPGQNNEDPAIKTELSGTALQVLQHANGFAQVRDPAGVEGWIAEQYLNTTPPAKVQLGALQKQVSSLKQQLAQAQTQAQNAQAAADKAKAQLAQQAASPPPTPNSSLSAGIIILGIVAAFAMLMFGFAAGVMWLREVNRKKLGGMYLRI